jgi:hypothetical protein
MYLCIGGAISHRGFFSWRGSGSTYEKTTSDGKLSPGWSPDMLDLFTSKLWLKNEFAGLAGTFEHPYQFECSQRSGGGAAREVHDGG